MDEEKKKLIIEKLKLKKALAENEIELLELSIKKLTEGSSEEE